MRATEKERYTNTRENEKKRREENGERYTYRVFVLMDLFILFQLFLVYSIHGQ